MREPRDDLIRDLLRRWHKLDPSVPVAKLFEIECRLREQFGGRTYYVRKAPGTRTEPRKMR